MFGLNNYKFKLSFLLLMIPVVIGQKTCADVTGTGTNDGDAFDCSKVTNTIDADPKSIECVTNLAGCIHYQMLWLCQKMENKIKNYERLHCTFNCINVVFRISINGSYVSIDAQVL